MTTTAKGAATVGSSDDEKSPGTAAAQLPKPEKLPAAKPLAIELPADEPTIDEIRKPYWVGLIRECPFEATTAGPISFEKAIGRRVDERGNPITPDVFGRIVHVTDTELELALERLKSKIIRMRGSRVIHLSRKQKGFRGQAGDIPLACFAYIVPGDDSQHTVAQRKGTPPGLAPIPDVSKPSLSAYLQNRSKPDHVTTVEGADAPDVEAYTEDWSHIGTPG